MSTAGLVVGIAAATTSIEAIATAGVAGVVAGAVSMALGENVFVSTQRDTERTLITKERDELVQMPYAELVELVGLRQQKGLSAETSQVAAREMTEHDALAAHLDLELGIDQEQIAP